MAKLHGPTAVGLGIGLVVVMGGGIAAVAEARPLWRVERRLARAQAALAREQARPPAGLRQADRGARADDSQAGPAPRPEGTAQPRSQPPKPEPVPSPAAAAAAQKPGAASSPAATPPAVTRAAFESVVRPEPSGRTGSAKAAEPAADGTVSVLVRERSPAGTPQNEEPPLRFPDAPRP